MRSSSRSTADFVAPSSSHRYRFQINGRVRLASAQVTELLGDLKWVGLRGDQEADGRMTQRVEGRAIELGQFHSETEG